MSEVSEDRARKRRWLNLAELVAVAGVLIAAAGLYFSWADRRDRAAADTQVAHETARFEIRAVPDERYRSLNFVRDDRHAIEKATVAFPKALGVPPQEALGNAIERDWFENPLLAATDGGADDRTGTLPVLIEMNYSDGDATRSVSGIYDIVWRTQGRTFPLGRSLKLEGLRRRQRGGTAAQLDGLWKR